ncbi:Nucleolar complex protein 3 like [Schistosoma japonicum]|nr:Nucleolar complex protein 3 like [Schistosoma japonicum]KAH8875705.1 Nucleolar complex protein 3 like [Schistosoma japonicum]
MTAGVRVSGVQHLLNARNFISDIKHSIAVKCENILRSPDGNMHSLRDIINTFESEHFRKFRQIRVLVIASLCIVFKDVLPAYRIRPTTEKEKAQPVINKCLDMKSSRLKTYSKLEWSEKERLAAIKCVCQLLESHPDFNYSKELIEVLPTYLNSTKSQISSIITMTLCNIFENDTDRDVTLMVQFEFSYIS